LARRNRWARPANYRGDAKRWVASLEKRLQDAKSLRKGARELSEAIEKIHLKPS
jgi:hypothetical protein